MSATWLAFGLWNNFSIKLRNTDKYNTLGDRSSSSLKLKLYFRIGITVWTVS